MLPSRAEELGKQDTMRSKHHPIRNNNSHPSSKQLNEEEAERERQRQIAKRKEQNRNAQRRLRERKEEYTMQLESQISELHRRSQSQEEQSHYLREMLNRIRAENEMLLQQLAMTGAPPPPIHRASMGSIAVNEKATNPSVPQRPRHYSDSSASSTSGAPWWASGAGQGSVLPHQMSTLTEMPSSGSTSGGTSASGSGSSSNSNSAGLMAPSMGMPAAFGGFSMPTMLASSDKDQNATTSPESIASTLRDASRRSSSSPHLANKEIFNSPPFSRVSLSRHSTDITVPSEGSETEEPANKVRRRNSQQPLTSSAAMSGSGKRSEALQEASIPTSAAGSYGSHNHNQPPGNLSLSGLAESDAAMQLQQQQQQPRQVGLTLNALSFSSPPDSWSISPWMSFGTNPLGSAGMQDGLSLDMHAARDSDAHAGKETEAPLAQRRGFSGRLKLERPTNHGPI